MPGFVARIARDPREGANGLERMMVAMRHRDDYVEGAWTSFDNRVASAWLTLDRLALEAGNPYHSGDGSLTLILAGELAAEVHEKVVDEFFERYRRQGIATLGDWNGMFSGVAIDHESGEVFAFCDRFGLNRLYVHEDEEAVLIASEAKAILAVRPGLRRFDEAGLADYLALGCVFDGRSLFAGIDLIPAGVARVWKRGAGRVDKDFFDRESWSGGGELGEQEYYARLVACFERAVKRSAADPDELALSLTGGVDSRMVLAWLNRNDISIPTFSFGSAYRDCYDVKIARAVAKQVSAPHQVIEVGEEFLTQFDRYAAETVYISDGAMGVSGAPDLYVNIFAKEIAPRRLTGNYGGEILRSLVAFTPSTILPAIFNRDAIPEFERAQERYYRGLAEFELPFVVFRQLPWHHYSRLCVERSQITMRSPYIDNDLVGLAFQVPREHAKENDISLRLIEDGKAGLGQIPTDRGLRLGSSSVMGRAREWFRETSFRAETGYDYCMPNWAARVDKTFARLRFDKIFLGRHKFSHFRIWYRDRLAKYLKEVLLDQQTLSRAYYHPKELERMVVSHTSGTGNYTREIHQALSLEMIERELLAREY